MIESPSKSQGTPQGERWLPIQQYALALARDAQWLPAGDGIEQRDLGLARASEGAMQARQLRATGGDALLTQAPDSEGKHFHLFYVIAGRLTLAGEDGKRVELNAGDCIHQPALTRRNTVTLSASTQVLELTVPITPSVSGKAFALEPADQAAQAVLNRDVPSAYVRGDGPRAYFLYRDLGVASATDGRIHIHILKATAPSMPGGTGTHTHTMCQLFYVFTGWADLEVAGQKTVRMHGEDAMCISAGSAHNVPAFSEDYAIIEVCIPAKYNTVDA